MALDPSIILAGRPVNVLGAISESNRMAADAYGFNRQREMDSMLKQNGAGIMAGDQNALNALAGYDPAVAMNVQSSRQSMAFDAERMQMAREEGKRRTAEAMATNAANLTAAQIAAERDAITKGLSGAAFFYQKQDKAGYQQFLAQAGLNPAKYPFEQFPAHAAMFEGALEALDAFAPKQPDTSERYKVVGGSLFDLQAEGGPAPVGQGAMQEEIILGPNGQPIVVRGGPGTNVKFTEGQSKDNVYTTRAEGALEILDPVSGALAGLGDRVLDVDPTGIARGNLQSDQYQVAKQAGDEFLQAILRKDTGAAITEQEQALYGKTYLPQPGDNARVIEQKKLSRRRALEAMKSGMSQAQLDAVARADAAVIATLQGNAQPGATVSPAPAAPQQGPKPLSPDAKKWLEGN